MPPESSPPPDPNKPLALPGSDHPMHGLRHPSLYAFAAFMQVERQLQLQLPNPLADRHWDEWHRQHGQETGLPAPVIQLQQGEDGSPSSSRRSSTFSMDSHEPREAAVEMPPLPWPPVLPGPPAESLRLGQREAAVRQQLPPPLPWATVRMVPDLEPNEDTVSYGSNYEYYGGSNLETLTSLDFVPWHTSRQARRKRRGERRSDTWLSGRGSKRHMVVWEKLPIEEDVEGEPADPSARSGEEW